MKRGSSLCAALLAAALLATPAMAWTISPVDMSQVEVDNGASDWAKSELQAAYEAGLVVDLDGNPGFQSTINRLQFAQLAVNLVEKMVNDSIPVPVDRPFTDCDNEAVEKASIFGIVNGVGDGRFDPHGELTREQLSTMLYRTLTNLSFEAVSDGLDDYTDAGDVSPWATDAVGALAAAGIMQGTSDTTLTPQGPCTVEQSILLIYRLYQYMRT